MTKSSILVFIYESVGMNISVQEFPLVFSNIWSGSEPMKGLDGYQFIIVCYLVKKPTLLNMFEHLLFSVATSNAPCWLPAILYFPRRCNCVFYSASVNMGRFEPACKQRIFDNLLCKNMSIEIFTLCHVSDSILHFINWLCSFLYASFVL